MLHSGVSGLFRRHAFVPSNTSVRVPFVPSVAFSSVPLSTITHAERRRSAYAAWPRQAQSAAVLRVSASAQQAAGLAAA
jgi:hypothetical protein